MITAIIIIVIYISFGALSSFVCKRVDYDCNCMTAFLTWPLLFAFLVIASAAVVIAVIEDFFLFGKKEKNE